MLLSLTNAFCCIFFPTCKAKTPVSIIMTAYCFDFSIFPEKGWKRVDREGTEEKTVSGTKKLQKCWLLTREKTIRNWRGISCYVTWSIWGKRRHSRNFQPTGFLSSFVLNLFSDTLFLLSRLRKESDYREEPVFALPLANWAVKKDDERDIHTLGDPNSYKCYIMYRLNYRWKDDSEIKT